MKLNFGTYHFQIDWLNFFLIFSISAIGLLFIYSATHTATQSYPIFLKKQLLGLVVGFGIYFKVSNMDAKRMLEPGYFLYLLTIGLLIFTIIKGSIGMGAQRWINLGIIKFQPAELTKLFLPAFIVSSLDGNLNDWQLKRSFYQIFLTLICSCMLIVKQPDLGTSIIIFLTGIIMLWLASSHNRPFKYLLIALIVSAPVGWHFLHDYQRKRIEVFLGFGDQSKEAYHIQQSKIAIGSGQLWGKGFLAGTQNKLLFLPESRTDFIFAVVCEEIGFAGAMVLLFLYLCLFLRLLYQIPRNIAILNQILAIGLIIHIMLSTIINIGMVVGLLPIVGIPLPLVSYGLTNLWVNMASLGWLQAVIFTQFRP